MQRSILPEIIVRYITLIGLGILSQVIIPGLISAETIVRGNVSGTWTREGSPYIVPQNEEVIFIQADDTLIIEPGVVVQFGWFTGMVVNNGVLLAVGTEDDSIHFIGDGDRVWRCILSNGREADLFFSYCNFYNSIGWWEGQGAITPSYTAHVRHSTFRSNLVGISPSGGDIVVENCLFINCRLGGIISRADPDQALIRHTVFQDFPDQSIAVSVHDGLVEYCDFIRVWDAINAGGETFVNNCIIVDAERSLVLNPRGEQREEQDYVTYNCFFGEQRLPFGNDPQDGLGVINEINNNGDSTDAFGNLFQDPRLVGGDRWPESYFLREDSPCIDAGDPDGEEDPDGSAPDIGAFPFNHDAPNPMPIQVVLAENWNLASVWLEPVVRDLPTLFSHLINRETLLFIKDGEGRFYAPAFNFNNIPFWNFREGYLIKMAESDSLSIVGEPVEPDYPIPLHQNWNMIAYFPEVQVEAPEAFANIEEFLILAKDGEGRFYIPDRQFNNMLPLRRGLGYMVKVTEAVELIWNVP